MPVSGVELCRAVLSVLCELYLRFHKLLLSDLSKWYQAVVLDNWQDPLQTHGTCTLTSMNNRRHMVHAHYHMCRKHTLDWLSIVADFFRCHLVKELIKSLYDPPPGGCWIGGKPTVHQCLPAILGCILALNFITFWWWHSQACTHIKPEHPLYCLCHCLRCQWSSCRRIEQNCTQQTRYCSCTNKKDSVEVGLSKFSLLPMNNEVMRHYLPQLLWFSVGSMGNQSIVWAWY